MELHQNSYMLFHKPSHNNLIQTSNTGNDQRAASAESIPPATSTTTMMKSFHQADGTRYIPRRAMVSYRIMAGIYDLHFKTSLLQMKQKQQEPNGAPPPQGGVWIFPPCGIVERDVRGQLPLCRCGSSRCWKGHGATAARKSNTMSNQNVDAAMVKDNDDDNSQCYPVKQSGEVISNKQKTSTTLIRPRRRRAVAMDFGPGRGRRHMLQGEGSIRRFFQGSNEVELDHDLVEPRAEFVGVDGEEKTPMSVAFSARSSTLSTVACTSSSRSSLSSIESEEDNDDDDEELSLYGAFFEASTPVGDAHHSCDHPGICGELLVSQPSEENS